MTEIIFHTCTRCGRERGEKYLILRKNYSGKKVWRCRAKSVCSSIGRRNREKAAREKSAPKSED